MPGEEKLPFTGQPAPTGGLRAGDKGHYFCFPSTCSLLDMAIIGMVSKANPTKQVCIRLFLLRGGVWGRPAYTLGPVLWDAWPFFL